MRRRRGISLIELMIVISIQGSMFLFALGLVHLSLRAERAAGQRALAVLVRAKLAREFRSDAEGATQAAVAADPTIGIDFTLQGGTRVEYRASDRGLVRTEQRDGTVVHRETYRLPDTQVTFDVPAAAPRRVVCELRGQAVPRQPRSSGYLRIEAAIPRVPAVPATAARDGDRKGALR